MESISYQSVNHLPHHPHLGPHLQPQTQEPPANTVNSGPRAAVSAIIKRPLKAHKGLTKASQKPHAQNSCIFISRS